MTATTPELVDFDDAVARYDPVIGIEVHVELGTASKMFDGAPNAFGGAPNSLVTPVSLGLPGTLPVINRTAVEYAIRIGLALGCEIAETCRFARKNYFYPDIPKNFQTSQYDEPIAFEGGIEIELEDGTVVPVGIERAHMEEDAGKNSHKSAGGGTSRLQGAEYSLVDYNRAGVPLVEIVTHPVTGTGARAPEVARAYVNTLRDLFRGLGVSEARMERGNVRADINVSLRPGPDAPLGTRTETKNVNSLRSVEIAVRHEMCRQAEVLTSGGEVVLETRHFHESDGTTTSGRPKESAEDYRYFPEPDLAPVQPTEDLIEEIRANLPELPWVRRARVQADWGVSDEEMRDLVNAGALDLILATVDAGAAPTEARSWWVAYLTQQANKRGVELEALEITPAQVARVIVMVSEGKLTNKLARQVVDAVLDGEGEPDQIVADRGLEVVRDDSALQKAVDDALAAQPDVADKIRSGKVQAAGAIVGAVMKATRGQADPARVKELVIAACS